MPENVLLRDQQYLLVRLRAFRDDLVGNGAPQGDVVSLHLRRCRRTTPEGTSYHFLLGLIQLEECVLHLSHVGGNGSGAIIAESGG